MDTAGVFIFVMEAKNPFDLAGRDGGPAKPAAARVYTAEEQAEKLHGYLEIAPEHWELIRYGTHLRYYLKTGEFRTGGFVLKNPFDTKPHGAPAEKRFIRLQNGFDPKARGYAAWLAAYEDLGRVFIKPDAGVHTVQASLEAAVRGLNENIRKLAEHARRLELRLAQLEQRRP